MLSLEHLSAKVCTHVRAGDDTTSDECWMRSMHLHVMFHANKEAEDVTSCMTFGKLPYYKISNPHHVTCIPWPDHYNLIP